MKAKTNEENKNHWNSFSNIYQEVMEQTTSIFYYTLFNIINCKKGENILEVGCGTGLGIVHGLGLI